MSLKEKNLQPRQQEIRSNAYAGRRLEEAEGWVRVEDNSNGL
jgi:hypothetical protein